MTQSNVSEELLHIRKRARRRLLGAVVLVLFALLVLWTVLDNSPPQQFSSGHPVEIISSAPALNAKASIVAVVQPGSGPEFMRPPTDAAESVSSAAAALPHVATAPLQVATSPQSVNNALPPIASSSVASVLPGKLVNHQTSVKAATASVTKPKPASTMAVKPVPDPRKILDGFDEKKATLATATGRYFLQVGAFADETKSVQLVAKLKAAGLPAYGEKVQTSKGQLTRIRVGPSTDEARANEWRRKSEAAGVPGKVIKQ